LERTLSSTSSVIDSMYPETKTESSLLGLPVLIACLPK